MFPATPAHPGIDVAEGDHQDEDTLSRAARLGLTVEEVENLCEGDIKVEYHPKSGKPYEIVSSEEWYRREEKESYFDVDTDPWAPFENRDDFDFAEFALDAGLNKKLVKRLFHILGCVKAGMSKLSFTCYDDLKTAWDVASETETRVRQFNIFTSLPN